MADETLLGDLCSICNITKSKYRCPGCSARTCSLPCYKRHQQWAQCSGKRDPASYVKKSKLATPAGIDHDFNFLTGVERGLEKAERDVNAKLLSPASSDVRNETRKHVNDREYAAAGVDVIRAPKGLSRQKENKTHCSTKRNIIWTVEWIHPDKSRSLSSTFERTPLLDAYQAHTGQPLSRKRKHAAIRPSPPQQVTLGAESDQNPRAIQGEATPVAAIVEEQAAEVSSTQQVTSNALPPTVGEPEPDVEVKNVSRPQPDIEAPEPEPPRPEYQFFLQKPRVSSSRPVVIPLTAHATLAECLRGRAVLEFPTIYVFAINCSPPQEEFLLEDEYLKQDAEEQMELEAAIKGIKPEAIQDITKDSGAEQEREKFDGKRVLDVLKHDLGDAI